MSDPTDDELLIINCLLYSNAMENGVNGSVYDFADHLLQTPSEIDTIFQYDLPGEMTRKEFEQVLTNVTQGPDSDDYKAMIITDVDVEAGSPLSSSDKKQAEELVMATIDFNGQPIIAFKGTGGDINWRDNGEGGYYNITDSKQQQYALDYFNRQMDEYPDGTQAWVSGHSRGGNFAQYVTVLAGDRVSECYSFDGQGFNRAFFAKYGDLVEANGGKIHSISNYSDFVNVLFGSMASHSGATEVFTGDNKLHLNGGLAHGMARLHSPYTIFGHDGDGLFINDSQMWGEGPLIQTLDDFVDYAEKFMRKEDFAYLCYWAMSLLMENPGQYDPMEMPPDFIDHLFSTMKGFAQTKGMSSLEIYSIVSIPFGAMLGPYVGPAAGVTASSIFNQVPALSYSSAPREFTNEVLDQLLALTDEAHTNDMLPWVGGIPEIPSGLESLAPPADAAERETYYRELITEAEVSGQQFRQIWFDVASRDSRFSLQIKGFTSAVEDVDRMATALADSIRTS